MMNRMKKMLEQRSPASLMYMYIIIIFFISPSGGNKCDGTFAKSDCLMAKDCSVKNWSRTLKGYLEQWTDVNCCSPGNTTGLTWWKYSEDRSWSQYETFGGPKAGVGLSRNNGTLKFYAPLPFQMGTYRCQAKMSDGKIINHDYNLIFHVSTCGEQSAYPMVTNPMTNGTIPFWNMPGGSTTLPCEVNFGYCPTNARPVSMNVTWMYNDLLPDGSTELKLVSNGDRYNISTKSTIDSVSSLLTIKNIDASDYKKFYCRVDDGNITKYWVIELQKGFPGTGILPSIIYDPVFQIALGILLFLILATVVTAAVMWKNRLDILLWRHSHAKQKSDDFKFEHDALLMHAGTNPMYYAGDDPTSDFAFAKDIIFERLENEYRYKLFMPIRDLDLRSDTVPNCIREMERSRRIIFILSEQFLQEDLCAEIFSQSIRQEDRASDRNIYIIYRDIPETAWDPNQNENFGNLEALQANVNNAKKSWLKTGRTLVLSGCYTLDGGSLVPFDQKSAKQIKRFWKKLCLALPPKKGVGKFNFKPKHTQRSSTYSCTNSNGTLVDNEEVGTSGMV